MAAVGEHLLALGTVRGRFAARGFAALGGAARFFRGGVLRRFGILSDTLSARRFRYVRPLLAVAQA
jgi:hypothetical protein